MLRKSFVIISALATSAFLFHCVGDDPGSGAPPNPDGGDSGGSDSATPEETGGGDTGTPDAGAKCTIAEAGAGGTLDPAFASGLKTFPIPVSSGPVVHTYDTETVALDSQGRIYVLGRAQNCVTDTSSFDIAVMRLAASGAMDVGFNGGKGYACFHADASDSVVAAYVDASDRLVFAGHSGTKAMIGRMLHTGSLDPAFNAGAILAFSPETPANPSASYCAYGISADGDGIIVSGGDFHPFASSTKGWVLRMNDSGGITTSAFAPYITDTVAGFRAGHLKLDGKIYLPAKKTASNDWTIAIVDDKGVAVGAPGGVLPPGATTETLPQGVVIAGATGQEDQLFVVGTLGSNPSQGVATWWTKAGAATGPVAAFPGFQWDRAYNRTPAARQCDNKTLIAASTTDTSRPVIVRLAGRDGTKDVNWGSNGVATLDFDAGKPVGIGGVALAERPDGRLVVVGQTNTLEGAYVFQLLP